MPLWTTIADAISAASGAPFDLDGHAAQGGGCINAAYTVRGRDGRRFFLKLNDAPLADMFAAESEGLAEIAASRTVRVPAPVTYGVAEGQAFLVMELLDLRGSGGLESFGRRLAAMHRTTRARFGWHRDNTIGSTPQPNGELADWVEFWRTRRLGFQLELAAQRGLRGAALTAGERLMAALPQFFTTYTPVPALLHGDLWSGNYGVTAAGEPVIFDPAVYFGDREADIAMTELFGGFGARFIGAYREAWPLDAGYAVRRDLYNLYHVLNHYNLFGGGYGSQAERMMERLLAELRA